MQSLRTYALFNGLNIHKVNKHKKGVSDSSYIIIALYKSYRTTVD